MVNNYGPADGIRIKDGDHSGHMRETKSQET